MQRVKLDRLDQKILRALQANGRISNVDLAKEVGISAPPCLRRLRALENEGYISGYHAELSPPKLGYNVSAFIQVSLTSHAEPDLAHFANTVQAWPQVREVYMVSGDVDFMLKVVAKDWDAYQNFLTTKLTKASFVASVRSTIVIRPLKRDGSVPVGEGRNHFLDANGS